MILQLLLAMVAGWLQRHQQQVIMYLTSGKPPPQSTASGPAAVPDRQGPPPSCGACIPDWSHTPRRMATIATLDTLMRWYHRLIAQKFDGRRHRQPLGQACVHEEVE